MENATIGVKADQGKDRYDLIDFDWLQEVVKVLTVGAAKYSPNNWKHVPEGRMRYIAAGLRHFTAFVRGEANDPEDGLSHLAHAACCLMFLHWFQRQEPPVKSQPKGD